MDNERPIEQLLKRYARQQREAGGAGPQLHEAARRALQAEVARQYPRSRAATFVWPSWWPRFALALGMLMVGAALAVYIFAPARGPAGSVGPLASLDAAPDTAPPLLAEHLSPDTPTAPTEPTRRASRTTEAAPALEPEAELSAGRHKVAPGSDSITATNTFLTVAQPAPTAVALASGTTSSPTTVPVSAAIRNIQLFSNSATTPEYNNNRLATQVMASFKVEQAGNVIRIIDQDGSVYTGQLQAMRERTPTTRSTPAERVSGGSGSRSFSFQAVGLNRSLNEHVTFSGNLAVPSRGVPATSGRKESRPSPSTAISTDRAGTLLNSRISGKAQVGANDLITVEAVAVDVPR